jgi:PAS domain S-box-containing protein
LIIGLVTKAVSKNKSVASSELKLGTRQAEFTRAIIGAVPDAIVVMDDRGHILDFNPAAERMFGYRREDVLRRDLADMLIPPSLREKHRRGIARYLATGEGPILGKRIEITGMRADGSQMPVELSITPTGSGTSMFAGLMREMTDRRRAEEGLRESEECFRLMANSAPVLIWMSGCDKLCTWFNEQWLTFVGRTMTQELGNGWAENVHPEDFDRCLQIYTTCFDAREPFSMEYRLRRHDGQWRWILDNGVPRYDSLKTFAGYIGSCIDITPLRLLQDQQMKAERKLRQRDQELTVLFDSSRDSHLRFDSNSCVTHANAAFAQVVGVTAQQLIGKKVSELPLPQGNLRLVDGVIKQVFQTGALQRHEFSVPSINGMTEHEVWFVPELSPDGSVAAVLAIGRDITEQKRLERELRQRESELAALFESSPDPHLRFDSDLRVTHANAAYAKMSGVSERAIIGKTGRELPLNQGDVRVAIQLIKKVFQTGQPQRCEFSARSPQGLTEHEVRYVPELSSDGSVAAVLAIGRDITEQKRIERELRQRERELVELYDNSPDPIARRDRNLRNLYVNAAWERLMGTSREKALGKTIKELGLPPASVKLQERVIRQVLKSRNPVTAQFGHPSKGGLEFEVRYIPELVGGKVASFLLIGRDVTEQKRLEKLTAANERDIRALSANLITAQEQERRRVALEIHDSLCQHLGALAAKLGEVAAELPPSSPVRQHLQAARENAYRSAEEARQIAHQLHPAIVEDLGLATALQNLCHEFSRQQNIPVRFRLRKPLPVVPLEATSCAYRVAQEALNNVARHACAKRISIVLAVDRDLHLSIRDDGIGFDPISVRGAGGLGLISMGERARIVGAKLSIQGRPGHGTLVDLVVPIRGATREKSTYSAGR